MTETIPSSSPREDLTGRSRFFRNVVCSWGSYVVYIVAGFVLPRLISNHLGQATLGVWDFAWTVVGYFSLIEMGLGASIDRYVAKHRAAGDTAGLTRSVSTIWVCMMIVGGVVLAATLVMAGVGLTPFRAQLGDRLNEARWIVLCLGSAMAVQVALSTYCGVIVGVHRWDVHNFINSGFYSAATVGMAVSLLLHGGLVWLGVIHAAASIAGDLLRIRIAYRVCPGLRISAREARWSVLIEQVSFSSKNLLPKIAELLINQSTNLLLVGFLGPISLAVFSRPKSLVRHVRTLVGKYSYILVPSASSLHAQSDHQGLQDLLLKRTRYVACLAVPAVCGLSILGDPLIECWMGADYVCPWLVPCVAIGYLASMLQEPVWAILTGMNRHGRVALLKLAGAVVAAAAVAAALGLFRLRLLGVALALTLPAVVVDGLLAPFLACRILRVSVPAFYYTALLQPLLWCLPFILCLVAARLGLAGRPTATVLAGSGAGVVALGISYYLFVLPPHLKRAALAKLASFKARPKLSFDDSRTKE